MLQKKGKPKNKALSYRPLSFTSCMGKILEKQLTSRFKTSAEQHKIFNLQQNGFRKERCLNDNFFKLSQSVRQKFNKKMISTVVFFDVEKAFDQLWHKGLLTKLYDLGLDISLIKRMKSFLQDRGLIIKINDILSELLSSIHGVRQGSPLSPILFILYVCDITQPNHKFMFLSQFVDDITIWAIRKDFLVTNKRLQPYLDKLNRWSKVWGIRLNPGKTKVINFWKGKHQIKNCDLRMNDHNLEVVDKTKFLGLLLDYNLNCGNHIEEILNTAKAIYIKLYSLKSLNFRLTPSTIINLFKTFIRSRINMEILQFVV